MISIAELPEAGSSIGVACSGGPDSTGLLLLLEDLHCYKLSVVHINHRLRGNESDEDEAFCRDLAVRLAIPLHVHSAAIAPAGNLEESARNVRLAFFETLIAEGRVDCIATGHTLDDQAETVLFRMLRGAHLAGLSGIHPRHGRVIRPLLNTSRAQIREFLTARNQPWREDSSNASREYSRNRIRLDLLPQLASDWNPQITRALAQTARLAYDEEQFWDSYIAHIAANIFAVKGNTAVVDASKLLCEPVAVARRSIRWAIERIKGDTRQIEYQHVEAALDLCKPAEAGHGRVILPGVDVMRSFEWLRFAPYEPQLGPDRFIARNREVQLEVPGEATAADGSRIRLSFAAGGEESDTVGTSDGLLWDCRVHTDRPLLLRSWKPGDCYRPTGSANPRKLKILFQEHRIPLWDRGTWPIITSGKDIIWARQFGPAWEWENGEAGGRNTRLRISRIG